MTHSIDPPNEEYGSIFIRTASSLVRALGYCFQTQAVYPLVLAGIIFLAAQVVGGETGSRGTPSVRAMSVSHETDRFDVKEYSRHLLSSSQIDVVALKSLLRGLAFEIPDHQGRFPKRPTAGSPPRPDWSRVLRKAINANLSDREHRLLVFALDRVQTIRLLAQSKHSDAAEAILRFAFRLQGSFRDECGAALRRMGVYAVPTLIMASTIDDPQAYRMARYASYQLDRMNLDRPEHAIAGADPLVRAEILKSFTKLPSPAAVPIIFSNLNARNFSVRSEARRALMKYLTVPPPPTVRRRLLSAGGITTDEEKPLFLDYRARTIVELLRHKYTRTHEHPPVLAQDYTGEISDRQLSDSVSLARRIFSYYDNARCSALKEKMAQARRALKQGYAQRPMALLKNANELMPQTLATCGIDLGRIFARSADELFREGHYRAAEKMALSAARHLAEASTISKNNQESEYSIAIMDAIRHAIVGHFGSLSDRVSLRDS